VCPVDKIVQGMWKNFLSLIAISEETISKYFSRSCGNVKVPAKVTKPWEKFALHYPIWRVFPIFSTKAATRLVRPLLNVTLNFPG
jgi:hypothetical protein